jgi:hypothetical protein
MDSVELEFRLQWALERQEAAEMLCADLKGHVQHLVDESADLRARMHTLKDVQETLLSEKLAAESSLELLLREKAELSGENASLRAHARDMARSLSAYVAADSLLAAAGSSSSASAAAAAAAARAPTPTPSTPTPASPPRASPSPTPADSGAAAAAAAASPCSAPACAASLAELRARLSSARYLVVRLLELARGAGLLQSSSGEDLWGQLGRGLLSSSSSSGGGGSSGGSGAGSREALRGGLVMALAEAVGVAEEMRSAVPGLPAADPLPSLLGDFQRGLEGSSGGGSDSRDGSPAKEGGSSSSSNNNNSSSAGDGDGSTLGGFLGSFLALLVGDVEEEKEALEEAERALLASSQVEREAALKAEQIRAAIAQGVEMEEQLEQRKAQLLQP